MLEVGLFVVEDAPLVVERAVLVVDRAPRVGVFPLLVVVLVLVTLLVDEIALIVVAGLTVTRGLFAVAVVEKVNGGVLEIFTVVEVNGLRVVLIDVFNGLKVVDTLSVREELRLLSVALIMILLTVVDAGPIVLSRFIVEGFNVFIVVRGDSVATVAAAVASFTELLTVVRVGFTVGAKVVTEDGLITFVVPVGCELEVLLTVEVMFTVVETIGFSVVRVTIRAVVMLELKVTLVVAYKVGVVELTTTTGVMRVCNGVNLVTLDVTLASVVG